MFELIILLTLIAWIFYGIQLLDFYFYGRRVIIKPVWGLERRKLLVCKLDNSIKSGRI